MRRKKEICFLLAGILGIGALGGCSKDKTAQENPTAKGSYIEEEMEGPWQEGESYMGSFFNEEGNLEVYTSLSSDSGSSQVFSYTYTGGGTWDQQEATWAEELLGRDKSPYYLIQGEDQNLYLMTLGDMEESQEEGSQESSTEEGSMEPVIYDWHLYRRTGEEAPQ